MAGREVSGWIWPENRMRLMRWLSVYIDYSFGESDEIAIANATGDRFEYPLVGEPELFVALEPDPDGDPVSVWVSGQMDDVLAARVETLLDVLGDHLSRDTGAP